uniref:Uncharacterized protein n=1 Tax=Ixodes ricinus TaxID=34613 RepID=A0A6B0U7L6_IXORI
MLFRLRDPGIRKKSGLFRRRDTETITPTPLRRWSLPFRPTEPQGDLCVAYYEQSFYRTDPSFSIYICRSPFFFYFLTFRRGR